MGSPLQEKGGVYAGPIIPASGVRMILLASLSGMDLLNGGTALQFVGFFVLITGLLTLWFVRAGAAAHARPFRWWR